MLGFGELNGIARTVVALAGEAGLFLFSAAVGSLSVRYALSARHSGKDRIRAMRYRAELRAVR